MLSSRLAVGMPARAMSSSDIHNESWGGIMDEESCRIHNGGIMGEESWRRGGIREDESGRRNHGGEINDMEEESGRRSQEGEIIRRNHGGGIMEEESPRRVPYTMQLLRIAIASMATPASWYAAAILRTCVRPAASQHDRDWIAHKVQKGYMF